ncbi:unnamed protein product [Cylindrotheca closterium]|uniref:Uncharacterized protein n=1 Tax=Cylindrotheca closterium TaxID=2856 RepID=A0AAD2FHE1_9STRA|nr:unnamed protein product [Cylindrotheca closterium]
MDSSSFVDVSGNDSNNDTSSKGSRVSQEDEWLDVDVVTSSTTNEERLRNQVKALQRALDEKNLELMESNVRVDVLKGHKILLENAKSGLQDELSGQTKQISSLREDLSSSNSQVMELEEKLIVSENLVQATKAELQSHQVRTAEMELQMKQLQELHEEEARAASVKLHDVSKLVEQLKANLLAQEEGITSRDASLVKFQEDMKSSQKQQATLQSSIVAFQQEKDMLQSQVLRLTGDARSIAVVAENLRVEKQTLERKIQHHQEKLQQSQHRVQGLEDAMANMQETIQQKEEENQQQQHYQQQQQEEEVKNLSTAFSSIARELEDSKDAVTQLAGEVMAARAEADHTNEALEELKQKHEQYVAEQNHLHDEYVEREELLRLELTQIQSANEERLEELRQILGLRFRDIVVRSKKGRSPAVGTSPSTVKIAPKKAQKSGNYIPPVPILRTVMGLV